MSDDPMMALTKRDLVDRVAVLESRLRETAAERDTWKAKTIADKEAEAISVAVKAFDKLTGRSETPSNGYTIRWQQAGVNMRRVVRYLADRYDVVWYEPPPAVSSSLGECE